MLLTLMKENKFTRVLDYVSEANNEYVSLQDLNGPRRDELTDCIMIAEVLRVKVFNPSSSRQVLFKGKFNLSKSQVRKPYDRLLLCREVRTGEAFYVMSSSLKESCMLMYMRGVCWLGSRIVLYEPEVRSSMYGCDVVTVRDPLVVIDKNNYANDISIPVEIDEKESKIRPFFFKAASVKYKRVKVVDCCDGSACDGGHDETVMCPSLEKVNLSKCFLGSLTVEGNAHICNHVFRSLEFTKYFCTENFLKGGVHDQAVVRAKVDEGLALVNADASAGYVISGFVKFSEQVEDRRAEAEVSINVTRVLITGDALKDFAKLTFEREVLPAGRGQVNLAVDREERGRM